MNIWRQIYQSSLKFLVPLEVKETYKIICEEAIKLTGGKYASVFVFQGGELKRVHTTSKALKDIIPRPGGMTYKVYETQKPNIRGRENLIEANSKFKDLSVQTNIAVPLGYGHIVLGVLSVISSRKGRQLTKKDLNKLALFAPIAAVAIRKTQLLQEAEQSVETRNLLISLAEHEIRNPLTAIILNMEGLKGSILFKTKKDEIKYIKRLEKSTDLLKNVIDDFLQVDQIRFAGLRYNFAHYDLVEICQRVVKDMGLQYNTYTLKFVNLTKKEKVMVKCDREKIVQAITNIINNSVKFSPQGSEIKVVVGLEEKNAYVSITDKGIGIPEKNIPKVFRRYYRGRTREKGMGLGLYLVSEIVKKHKGKISIFSIVGRGTTVRFTLPIV